MTPKNVPIRNFWIDDACFYQPNYRKARDCIFAELLDEDSFLKKYSNNKNFDQGVVESLEPIQDDDAAYGIPATRGLIVVYHYYNKIDNVYMIVGNRS